MPDCRDECPTDGDKGGPGQCGCGVPDADTDGDGTADCHDECPDDPNFQSGYPCLCDSDGDGVTDCDDVCPNDPTRDRGNPSNCDDDGDGTSNGSDLCPDDRDKTAPGGCGCGAADVDSDGDGVCDAEDSWEGCDDAVDEDGDGVPPYAAGFPRKTTHGSTQGAAIAMTRTRPLILGQWTCAEWTTTAMSS